MNLLNLGIGTQQIAPFLGLVFVGIIVGLGIAGFNSACRDASAARPTSRPAALPKPENIDELTADLNQVESVEDLIKLFGKSSPPREHS